MMGQQKASLNYDQLLYDFQNAPAIKLFRAKYAPFILDFLHQQFRNPLRATIPRALFLENLENYRNMRQKESPDLYNDSTAHYVNEWVNEHFIQIRLSDDQPLVVSLGSDTAAVLTWLENRYAQSFVGSESRFSHVLQWLEEIVHDATDDPVSRVERLEKEKTSIQYQINQIQETGHVIRKLSDTQLRELYLETCITARQLESDFSVIEQRFREMAITLRDAHLQGTYTKGELVAQVLDVSKAIRETDQGESFAAFCRFLMKPGRQEEFNSLLRVTSQLSALHPLQGEGRFLFSLSKHLITLSEQVMDSVHRVIAQLRRILDGKNVEEQERLQAVLLDIRRQAFRIVDAPPTEECFLMIEGNPLFQWPVASRFWHYKEPQSFHEHPAILCQDDVDENTFLSLIQPALFQKEDILKRIEHVLTLQEEATFSEILHHYPLTKGIAEIILYMSIAIEDACHSIDATQIDPVSCFHETEGKQYTKVYNMPLLLFRRRSFIG